MGSMHTGTIKFVRIYSVYLLMLNVLLFKFESKVGRHF